MRCVENQCFPNKRRAMHFLDSVLETGDIEGRAVWLKVLKAVEELLDKGPPGKHDRVH